MIPSGKLIYTHKGIFSPPIVKIIGIVFIPLVIVGAIAIAFAAFNTKEWWVLLMALGFFLVGLLPIFAMNSVELWITGDKLVYKESPFNAFPAKPIPIYSIKDVQIQPFISHGQTLYHIQIYRIDGSQTFFSSNRSRQKAEEIVEIIRDNLPSVRAFEQGKSLVEEEKYLEAIKAFDRSINENPNHAGAYFSRGFVKWRLGEPKRALADIDTAIELDNQNATAYMQRSFLHYELGLWDKALSDLERHIALVPAVKNHPKVQSLMKELKEKLGLPDLNTRE
jgi:tetratricopeptide (TPR) repeat protein